MIDLVKSEINGYSCPTDPGEPILGKPRLSINDMEGRILQELVRGKNVLEIGTGLGVSTRELAKTANIILTMDIDPWVQSNVWPNLPGNVYYGPACTHNILDDHDFDIDCAFIDSLHTYEQCALDIAEVRKWVQPGGMIILHDLYLEGVAQALIESNMPWVHIQTTAGIALAWNETKKE